MLDIVAVVLIAGAGLYLAIGVLFSIPFAFVGARRIDPAAQGGSLGFRLVILPGAAAFWPVLARRWLRSAPPPEGRNPHRDRAGGRTEG